jgi:hypothetical protein
VARAFNTATNNKVAVDWSTITVAAIYQGCISQRANNIGWHADLSTPDLGKYLETSTDLRWWTPSNIRVTLEGFLAADGGLPDDDGMLIFVHWWYSLSKPFQSQ